MTQNRRLTWTKPACLMAIIAGLTVSGLALAAKPTKPGDGGSGGDPGPVPPGTIYFEQWTTDSGSSFASMLADGSGKTPGLAGEMCHQLHGGQRWFLDLLPTEIVDEFGNPYYELFAVSEQGQMLQLTSDPNVVLGEFGYSLARWSADDSSLSFTAYDVANEWQPALFVADVDWSTGIPVISLPLPIFDGEIGAYDWSPAGDEIVYDQQYGDQPVKVTRFLTDGTTETRELGIGVWLPTWSPDGSRIAFGSLLDGAIWTIRPDGTDAVKVSNPGNGQVHNNPVWSPDSQHLAFAQKTTTKTRTKGGYVTTSTVDILRIPATGGTATNLTGDTAAECYPWGWR